jgi:hypothetical protein
MAPPDRDDYPRRPDSRAVLERRKIDSDAHSRMAHNAGRLASWVEWLLHPEEHEFDRRVNYPGGPSMEVTERVTKANQTPGNFEPVDVPFESVIARFDLDQFFDGMAAFATQEVETPRSVLSPAAAAMKNVWWLGDKRMLELVAKKPTEEQWSGTAADKARTFIEDVTTAVTQLNKIAEEFADMVPRYALIVKGARDNLDRAAAEAVAAFEKKFSERPPDISVDIKGIVIAAIVAGATAYATGGLALPLIKEAMIGAAWSKTFEEAAGILESKVRGHVGGPLWIDLAKTYMRTQADILADAIRSLEILASDYQGLIGRFDTDVYPILKNYVQ